MSNRFATAFGIAAALVLGCPRAHTQPLPDDVRRRIDEALAKAEVGDRAAAAKALVEIAQTAPPGSAAAAEAMWAAAELDFAVREWARARDAYRDLLLRFPLFDKAERAKLHLGLCHAALGEYPDALATLSPLYGRVERAEKPQVALALARAAIAAGDLAAAAKWTAEAAETAVDESSRKAALDQAVDLVDGKLTFLDIAKLAEDLPSDSSIAPMVRFKLAKIYAHLRDYNRLREALAAFLRDHPDSPFAAEARALQERAERRVQVKPEAIGAVLPLSGTYQNTGEAFLRGLNLALTGQKGPNAVALVVRDSAADPVQAKKAVTELALDEHVVAILGPVTLSESGAAAAEAEFQETPIVTLTRLSRVTEIGPYVFRNMLTDEDQARAVADWAVRVKGFKRFAVLYPNVLYGVQMLNAFWDAVEAAGGEVRGAEGYDQGATTFSATIKKLVGRLHLDEREDFQEASRTLVAQIKDPYRRRKALDKLHKSLSPVVDFDALLIPDSHKNVGLIAPALAVEDVITNACDKKDIEKIAKTLGKEPEDIKTVQLLGGSTWNSPELIERGGKFVECSMFVDGFFAGSDRPAARKFVQAFKTATATQEQAEGRAPDLFEAIGYDTGRIARHIVETARPQTRAAFREALLKVKDFPGATGNTSFGEDREARRTLFYLTVEKGEIHELSAEASGVSTPKTPRQGRTP